MEIYLPIAEVSVNGPLLFSIGAIVGVLSGIFGVGGGFLITPLLFFIGIPPAVAVATSANQIVASSFSAILSHIRRRTVDFPMGFALTIGGLAGSTVGVFIFNALRKLGQVDLLVNLFYVVFLGLIGAMMFIESLNALRKARKHGPVKRKKRTRRDWVHALPVRYRFQASGLYISIFPPLLVGVLVGILSAIMGVGGGFIVVPAMIYILGMPTKVVVGTSLFQIIVVSAYTTMIHAYTSQTVDIVLAVLLLVGGVIGAQIGTRIGLLLKGEQLRIFLALLVLAVCLKLGLDLVIQPGELFSLSIPRHL
ncbi:sulfite exporter TauE/SafE family protein [Aquicoccus sp. G2-2]|uniref:sulfite exporter TauE/SafE family protein n=1 Tax=Aquicoccus sp. G2-2 TaxID=3092120 RepID=UPI002ADF7ED0|nr:sulfite exporter TauE/SafE family protein [Aquicoccus sp. G2-2]MEA1113581.1 sulfite exporter TauE/SafE family protein [Aquicoccus sp. G2-2]